MTESPPTSINLERAAHKKLHTLESPPTSINLERAAHKKLHTLRHCDDARRLFSAYAEVFLPAITPLTVPRSFLCLRRGVSIAESICIMIVNFSLPTQRCFRVDLSSGLMVGLFSAYAEVFPSSQPLSRFVSPFLCLRRGVSRYPTGHDPKAHFSLPTQRCFSF